jgi:hypothetical protein
MPRNVHVVEGLPSAASFLACTGSPSDDRRRQRVLTAS